MAPRSGSSSWIVQTLTRGYATILGVGLGAGMTAGGPQRLGDQSFALIASVPGAPATWGVPLTVLGAIVMIGSLLEVRSVASVGLVGMAAWCTVFGLQFARAVLDNPAASVTGMFAYATLALLGAILAGGQKTLDEER